MPPTSCGVQNWDQTRARATGTKSKGKSPLCSFPCSTPSKPKIALHCLRVSVFSLCCWGQRPAPKGFRRGPVFLLPLASGPLCRIIFPSCSFCWICLLLSRQDRLDSETHSPPARCQPSRLSARSWCGAGSVSSPTHEATPGLSPPGSSRSSSGRMKKWARSSSPRDL